MYTTNINVGRMALTQLLFWVWIRCLVICGEARIYLLDLPSLDFLLLQWRICSTIDTWTLAIFNLLTFQARSIYIFHWYKFVKWEPLDGTWNYIPLLSFVSPKIQWLEPLLQSLPPVVNQVSTSPTTIFNGSLMLNPSGRVSGAINMSLLLYKLAQGKCLCISFPAKMPVKCQGWDFQEEC